MAIAQRRMQQQRSRRSASQAAVNRLSLGDFATTFASPAPKSLPPNSINYDPVAVHGTLLDPRVDMFRLQQFYHKNGGMLYLLLTLYLLWFALFISGLSITASPENPDSNHQRMYPYPPSAPLVIDHPAISPPGVDLDAVAAMIHNRGTY